jgi:hypothetical protein
MFAENFLNDSPGFLVDVAENDRETIPRQALGNALAETDCGSCYYRDAVLLFLRHDRNTPSASGTPTAPVVVE